MNFKEKKLFAMLAATALLFALVPAPVGGAEIGTAKLDATSNVAGEEATYTVEFTLASDLGKGDQLRLVFSPVGELVALPTFAGADPCDVEVYSNATILIGGPDGDYEFANQNTSLEFTVTAAGVDDFKPGDVITITLAGLTNEDVTGEYFVRVFTVVAGEAKYVLTNPIAITTAHPAVSGDVERLSPKETKALSFVQLEFSNVEDTDGNPIEGVHEVLVWGSIEIDPWFDDVVEFDGGKAEVAFPVVDVGDFPAAVAMVDGTTMGSFEVYVSPIKVTGVAELEEINVEFGTPFADIPFPDEVKISTNADFVPELEVDVDWLKTPGYDPDIAGEYGFTGELLLSVWAFGELLPDFLENPDNLMAEINVVVGEAESPPPAAQRIEFFIGERHYLVDSKAHLLDVPAFIENGRTFIPVRFLAGALGADADWGPKDALTEWVTLEDEERLVTINIGEQRVKVSCKDTGETEEIPIDVAAFVRNGRTFLPFRAVAESFSADVNYATDAAGYVTEVWFTR